MIEETDLQTDPGQSLQHVLSQRFGRGEWAEEAMTDSACGDGLGQGAREGEGL